jgi:Na+-transporting NADH:ubiquinone oxidoreductase subunit A
MVHQITKGLDIPISGVPVQDIKPGPPIHSVALLGEDYIGMRPTMLVAEGDSVKLGQPVMTDKKNEGVIFTAPGSGTVREINRGDKRRFLSLVIDLKGDDQVTFESIAALDEVPREKIQDILIQSGLWTSFRTRPYSKVPPINSEPNSIFVTAMDTNPLSAEPELIVDQHKDLFVSGLSAIRHLTTGKTFVCTRNDSRIPGRNLPNVQFEEFAGGHPAGLAGTHIHFLDPVGPHKTVWTIDYQDVIAIGHLVSTGKIMTERTIAVGGPRIKEPGLYRTRLCACVDELVAGNINRENARLISGSVLCGRVAVPPTNFLGRYHHQVCALEEGTKREFLGWQGPGFDKFSVTRIYAGALAKDKKFDMTTSLGGSKRAMVPVETYERVMPLDILPTQLLRALVTNDTELAQALGCLELDEEDLGLCTYVCPGKYDYGKILRDNLTTIEKEG